MARGSRRNQISRGGVKFVSPSAASLPPAVYEPFGEPPEAFERGYGGEAPMQDPPSLYRGVRERPVVAGRVLYPSARRHPLAPPLSPLKALYNGLGKLRIRVPERVRFCFQRKVRKEVMFALRVAGRGGKKGRKFRRTQNSQYRC